MLQDLDSEDKRKLHAEINQIEHQRFTLTTIAVTLFGVVTAWLIPRDPSSLGGRVGSFECAGSVFLQILLLVVFLVNHKFRTVVRAIACYLKIREASVWERHWGKFRGEGDYGYSGWQTGLFIVLVAFTALWPVALGELYSLKFEPRIGIWVALGIGAVCAFTMAILGLSGWGKRERKIEDRWTKILEESEPKGHADAPAGERRTPACTGQPAPPSSGEA
ncbi:MAG TPA: hypothetical protein VF179_30490 [Thermoanaerobaculia bacterium]|nr:hypothetical protein [Thermoanaerobaculia bacterium]